MAVRWLSAVFVIPTHEPRKCLEWKTSTSQNGSQRTRWLKIGLSLSLSFSLVWRRCKLLKKFNVTARVWINSKDRIQIESESLYYYCIIRRKSYNILNTMVMLSHGVNLNLTSLQISITLLPCFFRICDALLYLSNTSLHLLDVPTSPTCSKLGVSPTSNSRRCSCPTSPSATALAFPKRRQTSESFLDSSRSRTKRATGRSGYWQTSLKRYETYQLF